MNLNNQLPFAGDLLIYISNVSDTFPFCIDSLTTGSINQQEVSILVFLFYQIWVVKILLLIILMAMLKTWIV